MPPYYLCKVTKCTKSNECYRYLAKSEIGQRYHDYVTLCNTNNNYIYFMKVRENDLIIDLDLPELKNTEDKGAENGKENLHG